MFGILLQFTFIERRFNNGFLGQLAQCHCLPQKGPLRAGTAVGHDDVHIDYFDKVNIGVQAKSALPWQPRTERNGTEQNRTEQNITERNITAFVLFDPISHV